MGLSDLFKPKWKHSDRKVRKAAVDKLTDQDLLADIVKNDNYGDVQEAAVEKITDQSALAKIAKEDRASYVRKAAVTRVTDQSVLIGIAENDADGDIRGVAAVRVNDPSVVAGIVAKELLHLESTEMYVRRSAAKALIAIAKGRPSSLRKQWDTLAKKIYYNTTTTEKEEEYQGSWDYYGYVTMPTHTVTVITSESGDQAFDGLIFPAKPKEL